MKIQYALSLWNFSHYAKTKTLEEELDRVRQMGYGIELWGYWREIKDLYAPLHRQRLKAALGDMPVSLHTAFAHSLPEHQSQIDAAQDLGASVLVVHEDEFYQRQEPKLDTALCREVVAYAADRGVQMALENGQLAFLEQALEAVDGLRICLDVGHVYLVDPSMSDFMAALKTHIVHLHLQDILTPPEVGLPKAYADHYIPGTGGIPLADWELLASTLQSIDYHGTAVVEVRPRNPFQTALLGRRFFEDLIQSPAD
jgi:sugar phosphate isomerase/epimerase